LIEYLVDGEPEDVTYANRSGREAGDMFPVYIGMRPDTALQVAPSFVGLMDELRISRQLVREPNLSPATTAPGSFTSMVLDLGFDASQVTRLQWTGRAEGQAELRLSVRGADSTAPFLEEDEGWIEVGPAGRPREPVSGRYVQVRGRMLPGAPSDPLPQLSRVAIRFEPNRPPNPPVYLMATSSGGTVRLEWSEVPEEDILGYRVYYGRRPGSYFGSDAERGPSPLDVGDRTSVELDGLENGVLYFFAVAAYDASGLTPRTRLSQEVSARPTRSLDD
jgi:hypothetical protein